MWQRFTERSRRVVFFAQEEAGKRGENSVAPEHLLLGLIRERDTVAARLLGRLDISLESVQSELEPRVVQGPGRVGQDMQLTPGSKRVIDFAYDEARQLGNNYIGTEHLLLGLIRQAEGAAAETLIALGADLERTRREVMKLQEENPGKSEDQQKAKAERPSVGDLGTLVSSDGRTAVEVVTDPAAFGALVETFRARDGFGYRELYEAGQFIVVPVATKLKHLQALPAEQFAAGKGAMLVRILEGEFAGRKGWIAHNEFDRTGPDDAPFPPAQ